MELKIGNEDKARAFGLPLADTTSEKLIQQYAQQWRSVARAQQFVSDAIAAGALIPSEDWEAWYAEQQRAAKLAEREQKRKELTDEVELCGMRLDDAQEALDRAHAALAAFEKENE